MKKNNVVSIGIALLFLVATVGGGAAQSVDKLKFVGQKLAFGAFILQFDSGGTFTLEGKGWPSVNGNWKSKDNEIELTISSRPVAATGATRHRQLNLIVLAFPITVH